MPTFDVLVEPAGTDTAVIRVPEEVMVALGGRRVPVTAAFSGHAWRTTVARRGGEYYFVVNRFVRAATGVVPGESVTLTLERDDAPRAVEVPPLLQEALDADPVAAQAFTALSYSHQREYVDWILAAQREQTRVRRVARALGRLHVAAG